MNNIYGEQEPQLPAEKLAGMRRRVEGLNDRPAPAWQLGLAGLAVLAVLTGLGYALYEAYFDVKPEVLVETYEGVKIVGTPAQKDAQAALDQFHASPAYVQARQRALREMQQTAPAAGQ